MQRENFGTLNLIQKLVCEGQQKTGMNAGGRAHTWPSARGGSRQLASPGQLACPDNDKTGDTIVSLYTCPSLSYDDITWNNRFGTNIAGILKL